ncbi:MAG TPA: AmmeMemoRadiSam system protein A [Clostridiaceae bacterium]|nr:AmmeMemoRadiSam system protein A [Clostridiaceae bacterium]
MGILLGTAILPHPAIIVPEIGKEEAKKAAATIDGARSVARRSAALKPDTFLVITPHGILFRDAISVLSETRLYGDFSRFGAPELNYRFENAPDLLRAIFKLNVKPDFPFLDVDKDAARSYRESVSLDWGVLVPLYFLTKEVPDAAVLPLAYGLLDPLELADAGLRLRQAIEATDRRVVIVASGDLSHCLKNDGPYRFNKMGPIFDDAIVRLVRNADLDGIIAFDPDISEPAGECGLRSFQMMAGAMQNLPVKATVFSYEGPFGVGYMTAWLDAGVEGDMSDLPESRSVSPGRAILALARARVEDLVQSRKTKDLSTLRDDLLAAGQCTAAEWQAMLTLCAGCFVTLHKHGALRGCIGTIEPVRANLAAEIFDNARSAALRDPRFEPVRPAELADLTISVDVLGEPEKIKSPSELDVKRYGVIVSSGHYRGLLLPNLDGIDTVEEQIEIARQKAGIPRGMPYELSRFEVCRYA